MDNILLNKSLEYANMGFAIFPCREIDGQPFKDKKGRIKISRAKSPYTHNGLLDSTTDKKQIIEWWKKYPKACIGIDCGKSNLFVIDIDIKKGKNGINNYMSLGISDAGAWQSRTPSMGIHIIFTGEGKTSTSERTGIDTRGTGGYFIAPPSFVINQGSYVALRGWKNPPQEISEQILDKLGCSKKERIKNKRILLDYNISPEENIKRVKKALNELPKYMADNYSDWINVGLSLFELGDAGLFLWDDWSKSSDKYVEGDCEDRWSTFKPSQIGVGSLFYWSKNK